MADVMAADLSTTAAANIDSALLKGSNGEVDNESLKSDKDDIESDREVEPSRPFHSVSNMLNDTDRQPRYMDPARDMSDTSKFLRDILHTRERKMLQLQPSLNDREYLSKFMHRDQSYMRNGDLTLDLSMKTTQDSSLSDSDHDERNRDSLSPGSSDDNKLKRARVDSILTGMRRSPPLIVPKYETQRQDNTERRQKRKQFTPMQHGVEEPPHKFRRENDYFSYSHEDDFRTHLERMHRNMYGLRDSDDETPHAVSDTDDVDGCDVNKNVDFTRKDLRPNGVDLKKDDDFLLRKSDTPRKYSTYLNLDGEEIEPRLFIDRVCKLVREQEIVPRDGNMDSNVEKLAKLLKTEIRDVISSTVDTVVTKFLEQQKQKEMEKEKLKEIESSQRSSPKIEKREKAKPVLDRPSYKPIEPIVNAYEPFHPIPAHHPFHQFPFLAPLHQSSPLLLSKKEPEQNEPLSLVQPKKKRTKVTDTRLSSRAARSFLHEGLLDERPFLPLHHPHVPFSDAYSPIVPVSLPTSVAIPNPSLHHSDLLSLYAQQNEAMMHHAHHEMNQRSPIHQGRTTSTSPAHRQPTPLDRSGSFSTPDISFDKFDKFDRLDRMDRFERMERLDRPRGDTPTYEASLNHLQTTTLTPMHLRKAKLMFFYVRYPSSAIIKAYFPDIQFNKNNTAQLVKWFSNFREFYYIQMEKYSRQALAEGVKDPEELKVTTDCELYRVLNLHYNRNNQIEVPDTFRVVAEATLREFFLAIKANKDAEQSWKKAIYKIIARMDDQIPEFFKSSEWMERLSGQ